MEIRVAHRWKNGSVPTTVYAAVEDAMTADSDSCLDSGGVVEAVSSNVDKGRSVVANLVEVLTEKGLLTKEDLGKIIGREVE